MSMDSLDSDLLIYLMNFLPTKQLFEIECINKKWQKCVRKLLTRRITEYKATDLSLGKLKCWQIDDTTTKKIKYYLTRCQGVKILSLKNCKICASKTNNLLDLVKLCPKLEAINLNYSTIKLLEHQWDEFVEFVGHKLIECNIILYGNEMNFNLQRRLFKQFKIIEKLEFNIPKHEWAFELLSALNSCANLKNLYLNSQWFYGDVFSENLVNYFEKINYLEINFKDFTDLNCKMDNLIELKLSMSQNAIGSKRFKQINQIEFPNLKRFSIEMLMNSSQFNAISKFQFPNLEFALIDYRINGTVINDEAIREDQGIFRLLKNIKEFHCLGIPLTQEILSFNNLTKLRFECNGIELEDESNSYDVIIKHKSIEELIIDELIVWDECELNKFYEQIIELGKTKKNAKIFITFKISKFNSDYKKLRNEFKKKFEFNNWKVLLKEEINYINLNLEN